MASPQVVDGGDGLQLWRVAANILNKQSRTADNGSPSWGGGAGRVSNNSSPSKLSLLRNVKKESPTTTDSELCALNC
jgi:hypothetical protein